MAEEKKWQRILESLQSVPAWAGDLKFGREAKAEARGELEGLRQEAIDAIKAAQWAADTDRPKLEAALAKAIDRLTKSLAVMRADEAVVRQAQAALSASNGQVTTAERQHANLLRRTAPPAAEAFRVEMERRFDEVRGAGVWETREAARRSAALNLAPEVAVWSNEAAVAIRRAIAAAEFLSMRVATEADVIAELEKLRAAIPFDTLGTMVRVPAADDSEAA
jgi:hypothetical protein